MTKKAGHQFGQPLSSKDTLNYHSYDAGKDVIRKRAVPIGTRVILSICVDFIQSSTGNTPHSLY